MPASNFRVLTGKQLAEAEATAWKALSGVPGYSLISGDSHTNVRTAAALILKLWPAMAADDRTCREAALTFWQSHYCPIFPRGRWSDPDKWLHRLAFPYAAGIVDEATAIYPDLAASDLKAGRLVYVASGVALQVSDFEKRRDIVEQCWGGSVIIEPGNLYGARPGTIGVRPPPKLPTEIHLIGSDGGLVLGTDWFTAKDVVVPIKKMASTLVAGTSGFGKSVFMHQLITQLLASDEVASLFAVDLKFGTEFAHYEKPGSKIRIVGRYEEVEPALDQVLTEMMQRYGRMLAQRQRNFDGPRVFFVVDEYAQIHYGPGESREEKVAHQRLLTKLNKLATQCRAAGVVIIAATQKATADAMDPAFRANLPNQVCFRVPGNNIAALMLGTTEDLRVSPVDLTPGRCIFRNGLTGSTHYLQTHIAPTALG